MEELKFSEQKEGIEYKTNLKETENGANIKDDSMEVIKQLNSVTKRLGLPSLTVGGRETTKEDIWNGCIETMRLNGYIGGIYRLEVMVDKETNKVYYNEDIKNYNLVHYIQRKSQYTNTYMVTTSDLQKGLGLYGDGRKVKFSNEVRELPLTIKPEDNNFIGNMLSVHRLNYKVSAMLLVGEEIGNKTLVNGFSVNVPFLIKSDGYDISKLRNYRYEKREGIPYIIRNDNKHAFVALGVNGYESFIEELREIFFTKSKYNEVYKRVKKIQKLEISHYLNMYEVKNDLSEVTRKNLYRIKSGKSVVTGADIYKKQLYEGIDIFYNFKGIKGYVVDKKNEQNVWYMKKGFKRGERDRTVYGGKYRYLEQITEVDKYVNYQGVEVSLALYEYLNRESLEYEGKLDEEINKLDDAKVKAYLKYKKELEEIEEDKLMFIKRKQESVAKRTGNYELC